MSNQSAQNIISLLPSLTKEEIDLITRAYEFAKSAHKGQARFSGEPYFNHVYETAKILAEIGMDATTIAAGFLHDTIEDVEGIEEETIEKEFGKEICFLVTSVTKLGKLRYRGLKRHVESLRKLFIATSQDIRVLIIKLADRLHNMRTLEHVREDKRLRIASETMEVYAPIAHRLGIGRLKGELEDLAFQYIDPEAYVLVRDISKAKYEESERQLERVYTKLVEKLEDEKIHVVKSDYRRKHFYSLYSKLKRKDMDIDRVYDISALRVIVNTVSDCYRVLGVIHSLWRPLPGRIKDYIAFEKPNGYRSIHTTIFTGEGGIAEIQIRTEEMHKEAEFGIASHVNYKTHMSDKTNATWIKQFLPLLKNTSDEDTKPNIPHWILDLAEEMHDETADFMEELRQDFFDDRIFVFTPKGDVIDVPHNSTPIDFAYQVHSDIGDHVSGAKVNGKLVSLETKLLNGDIVDIITKKSSKPSQKWLEYAKTAFARRKIKAFLTNERENK
jgi:GTP diphosphokinase / guanosine-3',5'-bis(diphosphate) 3'-diphosphatase